MLKKPLDEKIKIVTYWTFAGVFWYLVVSFFLVSDYPIQNYSFNHKKAYDIIKDALTLAAAFLAPVAALVLFSDWRESHRLIKNEAEVLDILKNSKNIAYQVRHFVDHIIGYYHTGFNPVEVEIHKEKAVDFISMIASEIGKNNFSKENFTNTLFHDKSNKIFSDQHDLILNVFMLLDSYELLEKIKKDPNQQTMIPGLTYQEQNARKKCFDNSAEFFWDFESNMNRLDILAREHRIK